MYIILFGSCATFLLGYTYGLLFHYTEHTNISKKKLLLKIAIFIGRIWFLLYFGNLILKIYQLPLILL